MQNKNMSVIELAIQQLLNLINKMKNYFLIICLIFFIKVKVIKYFI